MARTKFGVRNSKSQPMVDRPPMAKMSHSPAELQSVSIMITAWSKSKKLFLFRTGTLLRHEYHTLRLYLSNSMTFDREHVVRTFPESELAGILRKVYIYGKSPRGKLDKEWPDKVGQFQRVSVRAVGEAQHYHLAWIEK